MIKIKNLSKSYGKNKIVENLSLEIKKGAVFGFLGPNGAGKTTAIKMIVGLSTPKKGTIEIEGKKNTATKEIIGFMPEDPYFYDQLTALEFLNFMGSLFNSSHHPKSSSPASSQTRSGIQGLDSRRSLPRTQLRGGNDKINRGNDKSDRNDKSMELLELVGLKDAAKKKIVKFSKGMKQRLGLAQAIINDPEYLFLDEPLDGLDPIGRKEFKEILLDLKKKGKTIFFNSHILSDVEEICDQIGIIDKGKLIYSGPVKKFRGNESLEEAFVDKLTATNG